jgi:hypothetical protein
MPGRVHRSLPPEYRSGGIDIALFSFVSSHCRHRGFTFHNLLFFSARIRLLATRKLPPKQGIVECDFNGSLGP